MAFQYKNPLLLSKAFVFKKALSVPPEMFIGIDNQWSFTIAKSDRSGNHTKHVDIDYVLVCTPIQKKSRWIIAYQTIW